MWMHIIARAGFFYNSKVVGRISSKEKERMITITPFFKDEEIARRSDL